MPQRETGTGAIGLDFGCKTAIADSNGNKIEPPRFLANAQEKINQVSKELRRKRRPKRRKCKGSRRWKKTQKRIAKLKKKVAQQRQNWVHHVSVEIVSSNSLIATEKLNIKNMTRKASRGSQRKRQKTGLNRSILDVGIGMLKQAIAYKAKEVGAIYLEVSTRTLKPTQRCAVCWKLTKKDLSDRLHVCSNSACNHTEDRDVNSAQVCLNWARGLGRASLDVDESSQSWKYQTQVLRRHITQLAQVKRYLTHNSTQRSGVVVSSSLLKKKGNYNSDERMDLLERFEEIFPSVEVAYITGDRETARGARSRICGKAMANLPVN